MHVTAISQQSPVFAVNSDRLFVDERIGVLAVLDGDVGAGRAAELALTRLRELSAVHLADLDVLAAALLEKFRLAEEDIVAFNRAQGIVIGTSATACAIRGGRIAVLHIGDTRMYVRRNATWSRVTRDHSLRGDQSTPLVTLAICRAMLVLSSNGRMGMTTRP
jgi:protein phosphatase